MKCRSHRNRKGVCEFNLDPWTHRKTYCGYCHRSRPDHMGIEAPIRNYILELVGKEGLMKIDSMCLVFMEKEYKVKVVDGMVLVQPGQYAGWIELK